MIVKLQYYLWSIASVNGQWQDYIDFGKAVCENVLMWKW